MREPSHTEGFHLSEGFIQSVVGVVGKVRHAIDFLGCHHSMIHILLTGRLVLKNVSGHEAVYASKT
ncbi:hypothetical protein D3C74_379700 [compost metagenome]